MQVNPLTGVEIKQSCLQICRLTGLQICRLTGLQAYRIAGWQTYNAAGWQACQPDPIRTTQGQPGPKDSYAPFWLALPGLTFAVGTPDIIRVLL